MKFVALALLTLTAAAQTQTSPRPPVVDNDDVRVLKVTSKPGPKGRMHDHKMNRVMIYLHDGGQQLAYESGKVENHKWKAGQVLWSPASGMHTSENNSGKEYQIVEIELKNKGNPAKVTGALDPVKLDRKHYKVELENDQVRVIRFKNEPHGRIAVHEHALNRVVVFLTDTSMAVQNADGTRAAMERKAGDVAFSGPARHSEENAGDRPIELIAVEIKK